MHREAKNRRNTWCISRFFNEAVRKICRQDGRGDLFSASLELSLSGREILNYTHCWKIEFMFRQHKIYMSLKSFRLRSSNAIDQFFVCVLSFSFLFVPYPNPLMLFRCYSFPYGRVALFLILFI